MSLLALLADNFELEPHHDDEHQSIDAMNNSLDNDLISNDATDGDIGDSGLDEPLLLDREEVIEKKEGNRNDDGKLMLSFFLMLVVGTLNKIFQKLQAIVSSIHLSLLLRIHQSLLTNYCVCCNLVLYSILRCDPSL